MQHKFYLLSLIVMLSLKAGIDPVAYHASNGGQFKYAIKELYKLNLSGSEKVLDIGSGDGRTSSYIVQEYIPNGQLVGIDSNSDMVAFACTHSKTAQTSYLVADICDYVMPNEYDVITSFWTLHWVKEYGPALNNIARSLKPGGKALLCHIVGINPLRRIANELLATDKWKAYKNDATVLIHAPSLLQIAHALEGTGLVIDSLEIKKNGEWSQLEVVKQNLLSLPLFDCIPVQMRAGFCDEVLQGFIEENSLNENNELFYWAPVVVMVLKKSL